MTDQRYSKCAAALLIGAVAVLCSTATANPLTTGNVVVSSQQKLIEYTPAGALVQTITIPQGGGDGGARDLVLDQFGNVQIYNGTFSPVLTQYNPATNVFTNQANDFSSVNNLSYGGIAAAGNFVYVTDMNTNGSSGTGLVRYNIAGGATQRFNSGIEYIDVTLGRNGRLYALRGGGTNAGGSFLDIMDPLTGGSLGSVTLADEQRAVTVAANGEIFAVGLFAPSIGRYNTSGQRVQTMTDPIGGLVDIDLDPNGNIAISNHGGAVLFTTTALSSYTTFNYRNTTATNFVAWVQPPAAVPEPAGLIVIGGIVLFAARRR